jgi:hypothetical protein
VTDFTSAKSASFSQAHRPRHPAGVDGDSPEYFSHDAPSSTDESRRERQGDGLPKDQFDQRYFSDMPYRPGDFIFSEHLTAGAQEVADRIRRRER